MTIATEPPFGENPATTTGPRGGSVTPTAVAGPPPEQAVVTISLLGRFTVRRASEEIPSRLFGGRLAQRLLRLLALHRGALVSKDVIAEALWPRRPPTDTAGNIEVLVSRIRRALGDRTLILAGPGGYTLTGDQRCQVDVEAFLAAVKAGRAALADQPTAALVAFRAALALWRGEPLAEDAYAEWAQQERQRLARAHLEALEGAAAAALVAGDPAEAAEAAGEAVAVEPLRETSALLLVRALAAAGDQAGALAAFDDFRRRLAEETGLDPSPEARQLRQRVLLDCDRDATGVQPGSTAVIARRQAAALHDRSREVLCLVALLGRPAPATLLADATGMPVRAVLDALEGLAHAGLVRPEQQGWTLTDRGLGETVCRGLDAAGRARLHTLVACALRHTGADPVEVARHQLAGGDRDGATAMYAIAARQRLDQLDEEQAVQLAETGLSLDPPDRVRGLLLEARGEAHRRRGRFAAARADLRSALRCLPEPVARSRLLAQLAVLEARTASVARGAQLVDLAVAEAAGEPDALGQALAAGAIIDLPAGRLARAERRLRRAQRLLERAGEPSGSARVLYWQAMVCFMTGRVREAAARLDDLIRLPVTVPELLRLWHPQATLGHALVLTGAPEAGLTEIAAVLRWAQGNRYPAIESECLWRRSEGLAALGRTAEAVESARHALTIATRIHHASCVAAALRGLGIAWEAAGEPERAQTAYRCSLHAAAGNPFFAAWAAARLGACLARQGHPRAAEPHVHAAMTGGTPLTRHEARWAQAELLAATGDAARCRTVAGRALDAAHRAGYLILAPRLRELVES